MSDIIETVYDLLKFDVANHGSRPFYAAVQDIYSMLRDADDVIFFEQKTESDIKYAGDVEQLLNRLVPEHSISADTKWDNENKGRIKLFLKELEPELKKYHTPWYTQKTGTEPKYFPPFDFLSEGD